MSAVRGASLAARDISIAFARLKGARLPVLDAIDWDLQPGVQVAVTGAPGSGKTALLQVIAGFQVPHSGSIHWDGNDPAALEQHLREAWRRRTFGYVFQQFDLFPVLDNVLLPAWSEE